MCYQRSTQASLEANVIFQGIYRENMQDRHCKYFTELVLSGRSCFLTSHLLLLLCLLPGTFCHFLHIQERCLPFTLHFSA